MSANDNRLCPTWHRAWHALQNDWLTEHSSAKDVPDSSIWTLPHTLELELLHTSFVGGDGSTFDANGMLEDGFSSVDGDFVGCRITVL